tara:strand:+ start:367 stop:1257 length:891 start_codon:yes stop_codon:yes gene_type:complete
VVVIDDLSTGRSSNIEHLNSNVNFEFIEGSILNTGLVDKTVSKVDRIFHLAAAVGVELIVRKPLESLSTNIRGTEVIFEKAHKYNKRTLVTSTSEIYGKNTSDSLSEEDDRILGSPLKSRWSYSEAKAIDEIFAYTYWLEKKLETVIVRLFNTVGTRQTGSYGMVLPRFVSQALTNQPLTIFGDGNQTRCFCSVEDVVLAMISLSEEEKAFGKVFNLGGNKEISIKELAQLIIKITDSKSEIEFVPYEIAYEEGFEDMQRRVPNTDRANSLVGFVPKIELEEVIATVVKEQLQTED